MTWFADLVRTRTTEWFFDRIEVAEPPPPLVPRLVEAESEYVSVMLRSLHLRHSRRGLGRFYGAVSSRCAVPHRSGVPAEFFVLTTPPDLKGVDPKDADRILALNKRLLGPVPYRGGDLELQVALLSVKSADLAGPFLELLETMTSAAGVAFVAPALALARPVQRGLDLLAHSADGPGVEVGVVTTFPAPQTGVYCLISAPKTEVSTSDLRVDGSFRLLDGGVPVEHSYLVLSVEAQPRRDDWAQVPTVRQVHEDLMREVRRADFDDVKDALSAFRRTAATSDDFLAADGARLADIVAKDVAHALGAVPTARAQGPELTPLDAIGLYD